MAPRLSGGVAHAMAAVPVSVSGGRCLRRESAAFLVTMCELIVAQIVRTIRSRTSWKCWSPKATLWRQVARLTSQPDLVRARVAFQVHFRPREVTTQVTTCDAPAITRSMLDLCSAPCKALRFASPALARGLRALTVPARSSRMGNYVMAGRCDHAHRPILTIDLGSKRR